MKDLLAAAALFAGVLPFAIAATLWSGNSLGGVLVWMGIGVVYSSCLAEACMRFSRRSPDRSGPDSP
jgi:hypothetical protein